jgi:glycerol-3-phosphate dehydrogenase (NAD(P)+)
MTEEGDSTHKVRGESVPNASAISIAETRPTPHGGESIAVINAGGWGTALAVLLGNKGYDVRLWARRPKLAASIAVDRENRDYLPYVVVPPTVRVTSDLAEAVAGADVIVLAVIAGYMREIAEALRALVGPEVLLVHGTKGLEPITWRRLSVVLGETIFGEVTDTVAVLAGPNHAEEVARGLPSAAVLGCANPAVAARLQAILSTQRFRVYTNADVAGIELCSAAKNVVAIAAGIGDGLGYGDNGKAALITRALAEIWRLVERHGGSFATVAGLAGVGDVIATCTSRHSRNRWAGEQIGRGRKPDEVVGSTRMVIEGVPSAQGIHALAEAAGVEMPICEGVYRVIFEGLRPDDALTELLNRGWASEGS